jgi:hypothetical protein
MTFSLLVARTLALVEIGERDVNESLILNYETGAIRR